MDATPDTKSAGQLTCADAPRLLSFEWTAENLPLEQHDRLALISSTRRAIYNVITHLWHVPPGVADDVMVVCSELLANALLHGALPIRVALDRGFTGAVTIAVSDAGRSLPEIARDIADDAEGLRGLVVVDALAQAWDVQVHPHGGGKTVTAVLVAPPPLPKRRTRRKLIVSASTLLAGGVQA